MKNPSPAHLSLYTPTILALEGSANQLSVAVMHKGSVVVERRHFAKYGHAVTIVPLSIETLNKAGLTFDAITHVAAGCGPGSFTGIRVTLAAAKGFCLAHKAIGVGVSSLQALARAAYQIDPTAITPCLTLADTRRGALYAQLFDANAQPLGDVFESSISQFPRLVNTDLARFGIRVLGTERAAVADALNTNGMTTFLPSLDDLPSASLMAQLAAQQIISGQITPLKPLYLADPRLGPKKQSG